jgi:GNAT superfamily N-acetyltransferase
MEGPRSIQVSELPKVLDFLKQSLRPNFTWSMDQEYPTAFNSGNLQNIRIICDQDKILSHAVWRPLFVKSHLGLFKVAVIGSVVTESTHREQGLSSKILEDCMKQAKDNGCEFAILWTDKYDFYKKFGFTLAGTEVTAIIDKKLTVTSQNLKIIEGNRVAAEAIHKLYQQHTVHSVRGIEEIKALLNIPNSRIYTAWDANQQLVAYAIEGKGADFDSYIHEWGGNLQPLFQLLNHIQDKQKRKIHWIIPGHSQNLIRQLEEQGFYTHQGFLGMIKVLNPSTLFSKILRYVRGTKSGADFELLQIENVFQIGFGTKLYEIPDEHNLTNLLFGPLKPSDVKAFDVDTQKRLEEFLPLQMWIWGWDSI